MSFHPWVGLLRPLLFVLIFFLAAGMYSPVYHKQIFDELSSIVQEGGGLGAIRGLQRIPIHQDMMDAANTRVREEVWTLWNVA